MNNIKETFYMHIEYCGKIYDIPITKQELHKAFKGDEGVFILQSY